MRLREIYSKDRTIVSFEVYPPKKTDEILIKELEFLKLYNPALISLTCGAGGAGGKSYELLKKIKAMNFEIMPHFTCISSTKKSVNDGLKEILSIGAENILALRGDKNADNNCQDFRHADELVSFVKSKTGLSIGTAGYPEGHIESPDLKSDIDKLKNKVEKGADVIYTQLFFDNNKFYDFCERVEKAGISIPVCAGIMPVLSEKQINKMTSLAKITVTGEIASAIEKYGNDIISLREFGIEYACRQCVDLIKNKVKGLHFFTLNNSYSTSKILDNIKGEFYELKSLH